MTKFDGFVGAAKRLEDIDIPRIGATIGVGEDELHAFMDVEAAGSGFDSKNRPKMLFEPHVFYRNLSGSKRATAVQLGLAYPTWKRNYPADSYPRLIKAMAIDETAALVAASWGLGQVLGENYQRVGYLSVQEMVLDFMADEEAHLEAIVKFLIKSGIADDLKAHRWSTVAWVYNGAGYRANDYDGKMARAFARWQKIKDTPWQPGQPTDIGPVTPDDAMPTLRKGAGISTPKLRPYVAKAQNRLMAHGFDPGAFDGKFGDETLKAVIAFQTANRLTADGVIGGNQTWPTLLAAPLPVRVAGKSPALSAPFTGYGSSEANTDIYAQVAPLVVPAGVALPTMPPDYAPPEPAEKEGTREDIAFGVAALAALGLLVGAIVYFLT